MIETVKTILLRGDSTAVYECRRCGTNVESTDQTCPNCDSEEIAQFLTS